MTTSHQPRFGPVVDTMAIRPFCGPAVLSILSGIDVAEITRMILREREQAGYSALEQRRITGMMLSELIHHIENELHLLCVNVKVKANTAWGNVSRNGTLLNQRRSTPFPTLAQWLRDSNDWRGNDVYLILTSDHYLLICGDRMVDSGSRVPREMSTMRKHKRARVNHVYCIMKP